MPVVAVATVEVAAVALAEAVVSMATIENFKKIQVICDGVAGGDDGCGFGGSSGGGGDDNDGSGGR